MFFAVQTYTYKNSNVDEINYNVSVTFEVYNYALSLKSL